MINPASRFNPARMPTPAVPVSAEGHEPQHTDTHEAKVSSAATAAVERDPERARLGKMVYKLRHPENGQLTLTRRAKDPASNEVTFDLALRSHSGKETRTPQAVYVTAQDEGHSDQSTIGYSDVSFPPEMRGMGMSYVFHRALADAGELLGVEKVAIDNVVSPLLEAACIRMGMGYGDNEGSFNLPPDKLKQACDAILAKRHWTTEPEQASRTRLLPDSIASLADPAGNTSSTRS
jgi:hypothetical protein